MPQIREAMAFTKGRIIVRGKLVTCGKASSSDHILSDKPNIAPFLGSGTTVVAAERTGRICHGIELDPLYVDVIIRRWQRAHRTLANYLTGVAFQPRSTRLGQPS